MGPLRVESQFIPPFQGEASEEAVGAEANYPSVTREGGMTPSGFDYPSSVPGPGGYKILGSLPW
ncbi:UNVERIFIED_CONTAM: hypothetical protein Sradi_6967700 [Sesamum radiatum]|uniref:Uncharacterized protein n=1 Tax=Sesamum radiatum TaxID=300843 RepID=A0AAW2JGB8_SESRA